MGTDQDFAGGWWLDWGTNPISIEGQPARRWPVDPPNRPMPLLPGPYCPPPVNHRPRECTVTVSGGRIDLHYVGDTFSCNFCEGDSALVAPCSPKPLQAARAPIAIEFNPPVYAVGAYVTAGSNVLIGARFEAVLWARLRNGAWRKALAVEGETGSFQPRGSARKAPFLDVKSPPGRAIAAIRFDVSAIAPHQVDQVAVSHIYVLNDPPPPRIVAE